MALANRKRRRDNPEFFMQCFPAMHLARGFLLKAAREDAGAVARSVNVADR
jgi:hypothetical protein